MEFLIAFGVTFVIGMLYIAVKKLNNIVEPTQTTHVSKPKANDAQERKLTQADEELITVILPTINNDK
jgi:hypothetical protein